MAPICSLSLVIFIVSVRAGEATTLMSQAPWRGGTELGCSKPDDHESLRKMPPSSSAELRHRLSIEPHIVKAPVAAQRGFMLHGIARTLAAMLGTCSAT